MSESRPRVPIAIERALYEEAGYRCAVPTCRNTGPFDKEHIEDWAKVKEHKFENMILLCKNCHGRVTSGEITKASIRAYKRNLALLNGRYSIYELRMIELFWEYEHTRILPHSMFISVAEKGLPELFEEKPEITHYGYRISSTDFLHIKGLKDDDLVYVQRSKCSDNTFDVILTDSGKQFIKDYFSGHKLDE